MQRFATFFVFACVLSGCLQPRSPGGDPQATATTPSSSATCGDFGRLTTVARSGCSSDAQCTLRTGMCGCALPVRADADQRDLDRLLARCDYSATCEIIDCITDAASARCVDGLCEIGAE